MFSRLSLKESQQRYTCRVSCFVKRCLPHKGILSVFFTNLFVSVDRVQQLLPLQIIECICYFMNTNHSLLLIDLKGAILSLHISNFITQVRISPFITISVELSAITINSAYTQADVLRVADGRPHQTSKRAANYI